jgi:hypothetical protein
MPAYKDQFFIAISTSQTDTVQDIYYHESEIIFNKLKSRFTKTTENSFKIRKE